MLATSIRHTPRSAPPLSGAWSGASLVCDPQELEPPHAPLPATQSPRLLDQLRAAIRVRHYSPRTEEAYAGWVRRFILFHGKRHPRELGESEVRLFLTSLALGRGVS